MTRHEAIGRAYVVVDMPCDDTTLKEFIDEIYDDFESRTCKNCKFYNKPKCSLLDDITVEDDFYCKDFEIKKQIGVQNELF